MGKSYQQEIKEIREKKRVIPATFDPVFKSVLTNKKNRNYLVDLISSITEIPKKIIDKNMVIINNELSIEHYNSKKMTTDILVEIEKNIINLEMNRYYYDGLFNKNDAYYHKLMVDQYKRGDKKYKAKRIIQINFNNFSNYKKFRTNEAILKFEVRTKTGVVNNSFGEVYHISLEKIKNKWYNKARKESLTPLDKKLLMLCISSKQSLEEIAKGDEKLTMFKDNLEEISNNEKVIGLYDSELAKGYENNCIKEEHEKAEKRLKKIRERLDVEKDKIDVEKGKLDIKKEKLDIEKEQLDEKAEQLDIKEEELNNRINEIARSMLKENMDIDTIKKVTSLTEEEIKNLL